MVITIIMITVIVIMSFKLNLICVRCTRLYAGRITHIMLLIDSALVFSSICVYNGSPGIPRDYLYMRMHALTRDRMP